MMTFKEAVKIGAGLYLGTCLVGAEIKMLGEKMGIESK